MLYYAVVFFIIALIAAFFGLVESPSAPPGSQRIFSSCF
jgi:uncharacterized membrane protein YtjA (UPF0391 family)